MSSSRKIPFSAPADSEHSASIFNAACHLPRIASRAPSRIAVVYPTGRDGSGAIVNDRMTFGQLNEEVDRYAQGLVKLGVGRGCKALLMVPPGIEFIALFFALVKIGAVVILIDPGVGKGHLLDCIAEVGPEAIIGVPLVHLLSLSRRRHFKHLKHRITLGRRWFWAGATLAQVREKTWREFPPAPTTRENAAAIVFTTGSTGTPKGALYSHGMLDSQIQIIQRQFDIREDEVGFPAFAPFALFCVAMGTTCVLPLMDPTKPAEVDPDDMIQTIQNHAASYSFGSPAFWNRVSRYCVERQIRLPSMKKIIMAGAPVSEVVLQQLAKVLPEDGDCHTPYGATEALPVTSISGSELLRETASLTRAGGGICVGRQVQGVDIRIIGISDEAIAQWNDALVLPQGEIGEIVVKGKMVTEQYFRREDQTALAKIRDGDSLWHRMGDLGYFDAQGRLWFCGRKSHRVITAHKTLFTVRCEAIFNRHEDVFRSALVGVGSRTSQRPVIVIEPKPGKMPVDSKAESRFARQLLELAGRNELTTDIRDVLFHPAFPVDFRHNAKISREKLAVWATGKIA